MAFNLNFKVNKFLKEHPQQKFTAREIAEWIFKTYPDECEAKRKRSTATITPLDNDVALLQQISAEIGSQRPDLQKSNPTIKITEGRPKKYYYTESSDDKEIDQAESALDAVTASGKATKKEHDLYPILSEYLQSELGIYNKRIDEKRSKNSKGASGNKWLYPDLVGMSDLSQNWCGEIKTCVEKHSDKKSKLWSFEVKILINRSNVRKAFFQTVSNCSWANFGYLVSNEIEGADTLQELSMLASLHGIGFIKFDDENPSESQIMIQAKERTEIDWDTANRLAKENKDFLKYITLIREFYQTGRTHKSAWGMSSEES